MATTACTPNLRVFSMCLARLAQPARTSSRFSSLYTWGSGVPACTLGPPPCIFSARTVATITAQLGTSPLYRHLMLKNFSMPMSAPKPASVITNPSGPASFSATWSATMELFPWAMFAKGPACTITGVRSTVCISVGMSASFMSTVRAPPTPRSSAVTGAPARLMATTMRPSRSRMSRRLVVRARMAMISEATVMSKPVSRLRPFSVGACPTVTPRTCRSQVSITRFQVMVVGSMSRRANRPRSSSVSASGSVFSMPSLASRASMGLAKAFLPSLPAGTSRRKSASSLWVLSWNMRVSIAAASRLFAAVIAWMSPVRCRLNSSIGTTCAYPPPAAPPLMPKVGPWLGCRMQEKTFLPSTAPSAWLRPMVVVLLPSPSGVGFTPVTTT
mmetsp:Transcript_3448/g.5023  ORF Transcript_3448/g.5023 Transcript_3448/m.5023 type:complete len:387 (+) Transcript_3448:543-1703(+)